MADPEEPGSEHRRHRLGAGSGWLVEGQTEGGARLPQNDGQYDGFLPIMACGEGSVLRGGVGVDFKFLIKEMDLCYVYSF